MWSRSFLFVCLCFCLTYVEPKHQSDWHNQVGANNFKCLIWIFWVCQLSPGGCNTDSSQLISWFDSYQLQLVYLTMKHHPARNLQHQIWCCHDIFDQSQHLLHTLHKAFLLSFIYIFTFLEIIKHNIPTMLLSSFILNMKQVT